MSMLANGIYIGMRCGGGVSWTPQWAPRLINTALAKLYSYDAGSQADSFLDDLYKDSSAGVSFAVNKPVKYASNPIFGSGAYTWDRDLDYASVITHADFPAASKYRMWYDAVADPAIDADGVFICYAYSPDGLTWTKDNTGLYTFNGSTNNNIQFNDHAGGASVIYQPLASADMRYLMSVGVWEYTGVQNGCARVYKAANPNGPWTLIKTLADDDPNILALGFIKYLDGTYGVYYQDYHAGRRQMGLFTSDTTDPTGAWTDQGVVITATGATDQKYSNNIWESGGLYYSMVTELNETAETTKITFYVSRDGKSFTVKDSSWLPNGGVAEWDDLMVYEDSGERIRVGNEWWIWYSGSPELHNSTAPFDLKIGLAKIGYRRIGSVEGAGTFITTAFTPTTTLKLNADVSAGILKVELLKASDDSVITGFSKDDMDNFLTDEYEKVVTWKGYNIPTNQSLKIKFYLTSAYSPAIANATPTHVDITFDRAMDITSVPDVSAFTLAGKTISSVSISGSVVTLTVSVAYVFGDVVTVSYTKPSTNPLISTSGFIVDSFSGVAVTNNVIADYTKLLLHLDNNVTDSSSVPKTVTNVGPVTFNNASPKFSYYGIFDGSTGYLSIPDHADFDFGNGDFTIEAWIKRNAAPTYEKIINHGDGSGYDTAFDFGIDTNRIGAYVYNAHNYYGGETVGTITGTGWHHVALVRNGGNLLAFIDGVKETLSSSLSTLALNTVAYPLLVGTILVGVDYTNYMFSGNIDEVRISKGIARWTANFTPPVAPY